ncbi:peptidoglycan-binding protein [Nonomuraea aridisoli]|uniref:Peptidoglycan binding-like domain-containing protein n=1 Tax=Nonomuraea aridisoli TaxID=2070368 RepID=A0A2W2D2J9_9ACTN|nr:peptidoglycan-binding protein [Nonomuraea aridisoli]PZG06076.1 hypothetical protein C1J01_42830 [Nonomuraea aridisoli]
MGLLVPSRNGFRRESREIAAPAAGDRSQRAWSVSGSDFRAAVAALLAGKTTAARLSWTEGLVEDLLLVRPGADSYDVKTVRACLFVRGGLQPARYGGQVGLKAWMENMAHDPDLVVDVRAFQRAQGLDDDGIVGPRTWPALLRVD